MDPIISPWLIWLIAIAPNVKALCVVIAVVSSVGVLGSIDLYSRGNVLWRSLLMCAILVAVISSTVAVTIPSREWLVAIVATKFVTPDNVATGYTGVLDAENSLKEDFLEILQAIQSGESPTSSVE